MQRRVDEIDSGDRDREISGENDAGAQQSAEEVDEGYLLGWAHAERTLVER